MWHPLSFVAESRCVDAQSLIAFGAANVDKYGLVDEFGRLEVSTWHVDALVQDFRAQFAGVESAAAPSQVRRVAIVGGDAERGAQLQALLAVLDSSGIEVQATTLEIRALHEPDPLDNLTALPAERVSTPGPQRKGRGGKLRRW